MSRITVGDCRHCPLSGTKTVATGGALICAHPLARLDEERRREQEVGAFRAHYLPALSRRVSDLDPPPQWCPLRKEAAEIVLDV